MNAKTIWSKTLAFMKEGLKKPEKNASKFVPNAIKRENIFLFNSPQSIKSWLVSSDESIGGKSNCTLDFIPKDKINDDQDVEGAASFTGNLLLSFAPSNADIIRSGYCGIRADIPKDIDLDGSIGIRLRIKTDGRMYRFHVNSVGWNPHNLFVGFIHTPKDKWVDVELAYSNFLVMSYGKVKVDQSKNVLPEDFKSIGITIADKQEGPFNFQMQTIQAVDSITLSENAYTDVESENMLIDEEKQKQSKRQPDFAY